MPRRTRQEEDREWMLEGACVGLDGSLFFDGSSAEWRAEHGVTSKHREWGEAKEVCAGCPVRLRCLSYAKTYGETTGVWGGLDEVERRRRPSRMTPAQRAEHAAQMLLRNAGPLRVVEGDG